MDDDSSLCNRFTTFRHDVVMSSSGIETTKMNISTLEQRRGTGYLVSDTIFQKNVEISYTAEMILKPAVSNSDFNSAFDPPPYKKTSYTHTPLQLFSISVHIFNWHVSLYSVQSNRFTRHLLRGMPGKYPATLNISRTVRMTLM